MLHRNRKDGQLQRGEVREMNAGVAPWGGQPSHVGKRETKHWAICGDGWQGACTYAGAGLRGHHTKACRYTYIYPTSPHDQL